MRVIAAECVAFFFSSFIENKTDLSIGFFVILESLDLKSLFLNLIISL